MKHGFEWVRSDAPEGLHYSLRCMRCKESFHEVGFTATATAAAMDADWINQELLRSFSRTVQEVGDQECPG